MRVDTRICTHCQTPIRRRATERPSAYARRQYCSVACLGQAKVSKREARFWAYVNKGAPDECWEWSGWRTDRGYGQFTTSEKSYRAHRLALMLSGVNIPDGLIVMHTCDNPPCCNPAHLRVGTTAENNADMIAKGRARPPRGERHPSSKLSDAQRDEIRRSRGVPPSELARKYRVNRITVWRVLACG